MSRLGDFLLESNHIEGIDRVTDADIEASETLLRCRNLAVEDIERYVLAIGGGPLRSKRGMDVVVGMHVPPRGGPEIVDALAGWIGRAGLLGPYAAHVAFEKLHPFMDGNGRAGRILWLRQMGGRSALGFLHAFYYQALAAAEGA